ncbi:hypothetical protein HZA45_00865 [Candidatus Peregrinibacteria bacterium]|nr:hypothetical protein [Candidatus Peregrinibacteria bacterium]
MKHMQKIHIHLLSRRHFSRAVIWAVSLSTVIVGASAALARAAHNFKIALTEKPDIAIYLLLPEENITTTTVLRTSDTERDYLAETKDGPKFVKLKKGKEQWYAALVEPMHEDMK